MKLEDLVLDKDKMYFLCPCSFGDTFILANLRKDIEQHYSSKIVFIIKKTHRFIMKYTNVKDYIITEEPFDSNYEYMVSLSNKCPTPTNGKIYVAHGYFHNEIPNDKIRNKKMSHREYAINKVLDLPNDIYFKCKIDNIIISNILKHKLSKIAPLEKIIMFCPDAITIEKIPIEYWENLAVQLKEKGYTIISSVMDKKDTINGTIFVEMTAEEALQLAYNCHHVYALRSGFTELCAGLGTKLTVFYPNYEDFRIFNFHTNYNIDNIDERIIPLNTNNKNNKKTTIYFLGIPIITIKHGNPKTFIKIFGIQIFKIKKS